MLWPGLSLYLLNLAVGTAAQLGMRFGVWHHVLYALVVAGALAAAIWAFHPALLVTMVALAVMPRTRPGTVWHPLIAVVGVLGYVGALVLEY